MSLAEAPTQELNYGSAVNAALREALVRHPEALLFGEDIAIPGGVFGCTKGLLDEFGPERVFDTPISESAILGAAVGASLMGRRPIVEIMWADFTLVALDQLVNQAANVRYVSRGRLTAPMTVRMQQGARPGSCAQHSQNLEAIFAHIPGLRVAMPSTPQDAFDLLLAAVATDDPAIVIENRGLYFGPKAPISLDGDDGAVWKARIHRTGSRLTIVALGAMLSESLVAAEKLAEDGVDVEVIDPRWLAPLDEETILASVAKTGRLLIVHEANVSGGFGAEVASRCADASFGALDAPIRRLGAPNVRIPAAPHLQASLLPNAGTIESAARELLAY